MKTKMIAIKGVRTLCVGVFMATLINSLTVFAVGGASGNGNGDLAFSKIKQSDPSLSPFEVLVRAFEESANNPISLNWETSNTWQFATMFDSDSSVLYNTYYHDNYSHSDKQFIEQISIGGEIVLKRQRRGALVKDITDFPLVSIIRNREQVWNAPLYLKTVPSGFSIKTEPDNNGNQWEIRQYNKNIIIFAQLPNAENYCINKNSPSVANRPLHGYCLLGYIEQEESK